MANINLRLYGEQLYPNISKYLSKYINPEIQKDDFISMYKNGQVELKQISLKEKINFNPQIVMENASIEELKFNVPNEQENFSIYLNNMKCLLSFSDIKEAQIESLLIENKKKFIDEFMKYAVAKIEKKDGPSFIDNLIQSVINKILNGLSIEIHNLELEIKIDNGKNISFIFMIENINYSDEKGIKINNTCLIHQEEKIKINVIDKFDFIIDIIHSNEEEKPNKLNLVISDFKFELNKNIYFDFLNFYNIFDNAQYKNIYLQYKKLILFYKPIRKDNKIDYKALWYYAIKTVIKLQKYIKYNKPEIFDLVESTQINIIKKYLDNENNEKILLTDKKNALKATKEKVEKKVLDNKKGNILANAFSFFFSAKKEEKKEELTEEEKETLEELFKDSNIINYINGNINNNANNSLSSIFDKIKKFLSNIVIDINISKLELILQNINIGNKQNLFIRGMKMNLNYINKELDFQYSINDIGYEKDKSFFDKNELLGEDAISFSRDKNNNIKLSFGFNNIELKEGLFICLLTFYKSIQTKKKHKLFKEKKYNNIIEKEKNEEENKEEENEIMKNIKNFSFLNNFNVSNIPSFSIESENNKIEIKIKNYSITENSLNFTLYIKDSYGEILKDFIFNPKIENNKFVFHLDNAMDIILSNQTTKSFFINYLRYKKELIMDNKNKIENKKEDNDELFAFNYTSFTNIDLGNIDMNDYGIDILINKININIYEEDKNYQSSLVIDNFKFLYEKKKLDIGLNKLIITTNLMSTMILYFLDFESPLYSEYQKLIDLKKGSGDINDNYKNKPEEKKEAENNNDDNLVINNEFNYGKLLKEILDTFAINLNFFSFIFKANDLIMSLNFNNINCSKLKEKNSGIYTSFDNWCFEIESPKFTYKTKKILDNNIKTEVQYELETDIIRGKMKDVFFNTNLVEVVEIWDNISFLMNQINWDIILCKMELVVDNFALVFDQFKYSISQILFSNFKKENIKNDTFYFTLLKFIMTNEKQDEIIYEEKLNIDYVFTTSIDNDVIIKCNNPKIKISQHDISFLLLCIKLPEKKENFKKFSSVHNEQKAALFGLESLPNKNKNEIEPKNSMLEFQSQKKKKFLLTVKLDIPNLNLCLCLNDYTKEAEFSVESSTINIKYTIFDKSFDELIQNELEYSLLLGILNFKYYSDKNNEYTILTKRKNNLLVDKTKNTTKGGKNTNNQVEIHNKNNKISININENEVNVRFDSLLLIYYYFKGAIPIDEMIDNLEKAELNMNNNKKNFELSINCYDSGFQLCTSFDNTENLYLDIDQFIFMYNCNLEGKLPYGRYIMILNKLSAIATSKNSVRELFLTNDNFLKVSMDYKKMLLTSNIDLDTITINLSYEDLYYFLRVYSINMKLISNAMNKSKEYLKNLELCNKKENQNNIQDKKSVAVNLPNNKINELINKGKIALVCVLNFEKLDITLIDNSEESYQPFMNLTINNIYLVLKQDNSFESTFSFILSSYNYIACVWEPTIEKTIIKLNNKYENERGEKKNNSKIEIDSININLSDMALSFTLLTFRKWLSKLENNQVKGKISDSKNEINENKEINIKKITNNKVINYTGIELKIIHNNKEINCPPLGEIELDYINETNQTKKSRCIDLIYDKLKIEIPIEKLGSLQHKINDTLSIISENSLSEKRSIITSLFSPIIIINKSVFPLQIQIYHNKLGNHFCELKQNSIFGIPLTFINNDTSFNFKLINQKESNDDDFSKSYSIETILNIKNGINDKRPIYFKDKTLMMNIENTENTNLRTITIFSEYSIANGLPCDIVMNMSNRQIIINKCSQYFIDFNFTSNLLVNFSMSTENGVFTTDNINITYLISTKNNNSDNTIIFRNKQSNRYFTLLYNLKKEDGENIFIIYAEYIIYNDTLSQVNIIPHEQKQKILCFSVTKNVHLISSKIDFKTEKISLRSDNHFSSKFLITHLIESIPYLKVLLRNKNNNKTLNFNIKKHFSYIQMINNQKLKINIRSMIFNIFDSCRIINLLKDKKFIICDYNHSQDYYLEIAPFKKEGFQFFGQGPDIVLGLSVINENEKNWKNLVKFKFEIGIITLTVDDYTFNLEISINSSTGVVEVFVTESTIDNCQIILENLSNEGVCIYQNRFDNNMQILLPHQTQILKTYDYYSRNFIIEAEGSVDIETFIIDKNDKKIRNLNKNLMLLIDNNGLKMKATFYNIEDFKKLESVLINYEVSIKINKIYLSIITDNEYSDSKLIKYKRNELLLFIISNFCIDLSREKIEGPLKKDFIRLSININDMKIYNQKSINGKFSCFFKNTTSPFITFCNEINYYNELRIAKIDYQAFELGRMEVGIDPAFINDIFNFLDNILYRMNITNFNIHKLYLLISEEDEQKNIINEYNKANILINATNLDFPPFYIKFELSDVGVDQFLKERMGCSEFYIWVIKGLIGNRHKLTLDKEKLTYKNGGIIQYLKWFYDHYEEKIEGKITTMGITGIFGHFKNMLAVDDQNKTKVQENRVRVPRVFYGKFQYMKKYNEKEELLIKNTFIVNYKVLKDKYYPNSIIIGKNEFFLFTHIALLNVKTSNYEIKKNIKYYFIKNIEPAKNKIKVNYTQTIDSREFYVIICDDDEIAKNVCQFLNEEINNNREYFYHI